MIRRLCNAVTSRLERGRHHAELRRSAAEVFSGRRVLSGPFAGLRYPGLEGHGSAILAKLLGTYEAELHDFVEQVLRTAPPTIVDVGCAEGYYAVGCALRQPDARIVAADISPHARELCAEMAQLNGVAGQVCIMGKVTREILMKFGAESAGWIICDCEGGEEELFDKEVVQSLASWSLLIELHEHIVPGIEERLSPLLGETHDMAVIDSVDDFRRQRIWPSNRVADLPSKLRFEFYYEGRPGLMRWICASPKMI